MDESAAIARLRSGDLAGLEPLVRIHQTRALRAAYLITRDRAAAEDIVQDAFVRAAQRIAQLRPGASFGPWFLRIVANDAVKTAQRARRWVTPPMDDRGAALNTLADPHAGPEETYLELERRQALQAALDALTSEQRAVAVLRYYLDLRETDVAEWLGMPLGTVKWRLHEARRRLRLAIDSSLDRPASTAKEGRGG